MTAIPSGFSRGRMPQSGISTSGVGTSLRSAVARPKQLGARLVRPSARPDASSATSAAPGAANSVAVATAPVGIAGVPSLLGLRHLRVVVAGGRIRMGNGAFVIFVLVSLTTMLGALLFLNTALSETSFQVTNIRTDMRDMTVREQVLSAQLAAAESPIGLEQKAREMGMIPAGSPLFLDLGQDKIRGVQTPADAHSPLEVPPKYLQTTPKGESDAKPMTQDPTAAGGEFESGGSAATGGESAVTSSSGQPASGGEQQVETHAGAVR